MDREETAQVFHEAKSWLITALQCYRRCLSVTGATATANDQRVVFRIVKIWFSLCGGADGGLNAFTRGNAADDAALINQVNDEVHKLVKSTAVPSSKFLAGG